MVAAVDTFAATSADRRILSVPLVTIGWELALSFITIGITSFVVQIYFIHKTWVSYNRNRFLLIAYAPFSLFTLAGSIASAVLEIRAGSAANVRGAALNVATREGSNNNGFLFSVVFATWLCSNALIDVSLCILLIRQLLKIQSPFFHTRNAIARLILLFLETCVLTAGRECAREERRLSDVRF